MGHYGVVVRDGEERRLRVYNNLPHEFSVKLSRENVTLVVVLLSGSLVRCTCGTEAIYVGLHDLFEFKRTVARPHVPARSQLCTDEVAMASCS